MVAGGRRLAPLAAALSSFALAVALDGNGFIAAFVAGIAFGAQLKKDAARGGVEEAVELPELVARSSRSSCGSCSVRRSCRWCVDHLDVPTVVYALLSLTVLRMVPVAVALLGSGLDRRTVLFVGWFGPRGWPRSSSPSWRSRSWASALWSGRRSPRCA